MTLRQTLADHRSILLLLCVLLTIGYPGLAENFTAGLAAAQAGNLSEAKQLLEAEVKARPSAGAFQNLGIVEWQRGHAGEAILAWERAQWIDPFDREAGRNLEFARAIAQVEEPELRWHEKISTWLPPNAWVWIAGAGLWLAIGALVLPRGLRRRKSEWRQFAAAFGCCIFIVAMTANFGVVSRTHIGFVLKKNTVLRLTPTSGSETVSLLPPGEPVRTIRRRGDYVFVRTPMAAGWLGAGELGMIAEPGSAR